MTLFTDLSLHLIHPTRWRLITSNTSNLFTLMGKRFWSWSLLVQTCDSGYPWPPDPSCFQVHRQLLQLVCILLLAPIAIYILFALQNGTCSLAMAICCVTVLHVGTCIYCFGHHSSESSRKWLAKADRPKMFPGYLMICDAWTPVLQQLQRPSAEEEELRNGVPGTSFSFFGA
jgi:hypothetical protein